MDPDQQQQQYIPYEADIPTVENRFQNEAIVKNALLAETDLRPWFCANADQQAASVAWKSGIKRLIMSAFDNSKVLAWLDSGREGSLTTFESVVRFRILINLFHASVKPSDRKNPSLITFADSLIWNYLHYISRASGMEERKLQGKFSMSTENTQTIKNVAPPQEKRGIGGALDMFKH